MAEDTQKKATRPTEQLQLQIIASVAAPPPPEQPTATPPLPSPPRSTGVEERYTRPTRPPFGTWLAHQQPSTNEFRTMLVRAAKADPGFPRNADPDGVRKHLGLRGADGDVFEALDDAELDWLAL